MRIDFLEPNEHDTDQLLDHRARRPTMSLNNGVHAGLTWPDKATRPAGSSARA